MIRIERSSAESLDEAARLMEKVWRQTDTKEWFVIEEKEWLKERMQSGRGILYQAFDAGKGQMAGVLFVVLPGNVEDNLGEDAGIAQDQLQKVAHMDTAAVLPEYRGQKLQYKMMQMAEKDLRDMGYRYLMCTVHPDNRFSRNNITGQGYTLVATKRKYGGYLRDIMWKELTGGGK